ncbi:hypothetical protein N9W46_08175 [Litoricolaceae bacterium]|nr:hypothetical protein [Litorivicinaceae bacterium]
MRFIRDVLAVSIGVFLGFAAIVNSYELIDIVYAFSQLQDLNLLGILTESMGGQR